MDDRSRPKNENLAAREKKNMTYHQDALVSVHQILLGSRPVPRGGCHVPSSQVTQSREARGEHAPTRREVRGARKHAVILFSPAVHF
jgi:hypothetical protein